MPKPKRKPEVDEAIMDELLAQPGIAEFVVNMTDEERAWYRDLLVREGLYARYVEERERK